MCFSPWPSQNLICDYVFALEIYKTGVGFFHSICLVLTLIENANAFDLRQQVGFTLSLHKLENMYQISANKVSNVKLESLVLKNLKTGKSDPWLLCSNHSNGPDSLGPM